MRGVWKSRRLDYTCAWSIFNPYDTRTDRCLAFARSVRLPHASADAYSAWSVGILCSPATRADALCMEVAAARRNVRVVHGLASPKDAAGYIRCAQVVV